MKATYYLLIYGLTLFIPALFTQAQTTAIPNKFLITYAGSVGSAPVQLLLERKQKQLQGLYYYKQHQKMLYLTGTIQDSGDFELKEWTTPSPNDENYKQTGVFRGTLTDNNQLSGIWIEQVKNVSLQIYENGTKSFFFDLKKQTAPNLSPKQLKDTLTQVNNSVALQFLVAKYIIEGIDFQYLYYGDGYQTPYTNIHPNNLEVDLFGCNLFGDQKAEAVLQVRFNNWLYLIAAFYPDNDQWKKVPNYLHFNRGNTANQPCRTSVPNDHYFLFSLVEAQKAKEYVLEGRAYGGSCSGEYRGDEIYYYVWTVDKKGMHIAYNEIETKYNYVSSTSEVLEPPIDIQFQWVSSPHHPFPKQLKRKEVHYQVHSEMQNVSDKPVGYTTKIGETTDVIKLF